MRPISVVILLFVEIVTPGLVLGGGEHEQSYFAAESDLSPARPEPDKRILGEIEDIILLPWGIMLPARIDTGAAVSSLDARDLSVEDNTAEFELGENYGGRRITLPLAGWRRVKTSVGSADRPVVELRICIGTKIVRTLATLTDRSGMTYPFLVGRSALAGGFLVDASRSHTAPPTCPTDSSQ